jgi:hypothetical protein
MGVNGAQPPSVRPWASASRRFPLQRRDILVTILLGCAAFVLALTIFTYAPWPHHWDATGYAIRAIELMGADGPAEYLRRFPGSHGPILPLLNSLALAVIPVGNAFWPMAAVQILALIVTVTIGYLAVRSGAPVLTAAAALLTYLLHPSQLAWSTELMHEGPAMAVLALWMFATALDANRATPRTFGFAAVATGFLTISRLNFAAPGVVAFGTYALWRLARATRGERWTLAGYAAAPLLLTTVLWHAGTNFHQFRYYFSYTSMDPSLQLYWQGSSQSWPMMQLEFLLHIVQYRGTATVLLIGIAAIVALVQLLRRGYGPHTATFVFLVVVSVLVAVSQGKQERFLVPALLPALATLAWMAHDEFWPRTARRAAHLLLIMALASQVLQWAERLGMPMPAPVRLALRLDTGPPHTLKGASSASGRLTDRVLRAAGPEARVVFIGNGYQINNVYLDYWNTVRRSPLSWEYLWDPLQPETFPQRVRAQLPRADYLLFAPATAEDGRQYRTGSQFVEQIVTRWTADGRMRPVFAEPALGVTLYAVNADAQP